METECTMLRSRTLCEQWTRCFAHMFHRVVSSARILNYWFLQSGSLPVLSRIMTPLLGVITPVTHFLRPFIGVRTETITIVGAHLVLVATWFGGRLAWTLWPPAEMFAAMCCAHPAQMFVSWHHIYVASWSTQQQCQLPMLLGKCVGGNEQSEKSGEKLKKLLSGLLALKKSIFPPKTEFVFSVFPTASWTLLAWFETRGSKELHNEILHYTYDIHDHCLPRFLVKRHLNEWKKKGGLSQERAPTIEKTHEIMLLTQKISLAAPGICHNNRKEWDKLPAP